MGTMRAKVRVSNIEILGDPKTGEILTFDAVAKADGYPSDGSDENNTFAKFSPAAHFSIQVANPALFGAFEVGEYYYVDLARAE